MNTLLNITNVHIFVDPSRIQQNDPPFVVSWKLDGKMQYNFFWQVCPANRFADKLTSKTCRE